MIFNAAASASLDHVLITNAGGRIPIEGNFDQFNAIEVKQAELRLTNSILEHNASGLASTDRNGRGMNREAVIFVRGAQPVIVDNIFRNNTVHDNLLTPNHVPLGTHMISINANALTSSILADPGRTTGAIDLVRDPTTNSPAFTNNRGPLIRRNLVENNGVSGMEVRGEELTTETTWDDTDIVHVLRDEISVLNHHTFSGLRLQSNPGESLVVKLGSRPRVIDDANLVDLRFQGPNIFGDRFLDAGFTAGQGLKISGSNQNDGSYTIASVTQTQIILTSNLAFEFAPVGTSLSGITGFTADGTPLDIDDRIGGSVQLLGFADFPVVMTSLADDTQGASFSVDGLPHSDTNADGSATIPTAGDWRGILLEKYSNDRNVSVVNEIEPSFTGTTDQNATPVNAQFLGELAPDEKSGDENRTLGFTVNGFIAVDDPTDADVFSFKAIPGTEVWLDIDRTAASLDAVVELVKQNGSLLARSIDANDLTGSAHGHRAEHDP